MELPDVRPVQRSTTSAKVRQARVQKLHHGRVRAFLGREHWPPSGPHSGLSISHMVTSSALARRGMQAGKVDLRNLRQRCPHRHKGLACRVAEHCTQRCRSAAASIVCGAASQPHHQPFAAALNAWAISSPTP